MEWHNSYRILGLKREGVQGWSDVLDSWLKTSDAQTLLHKFEQAERDGRRIFPESQHRLRALELTPLSAVRIVILGQDPYHRLDANTGLAQAHGLAFSVTQGVQCPASLRNIFAELTLELGLRRSNTSLEDWANQGVLLLNTILTVEEGQPSSHAGWGWESLTTAVLKAVLEKAFMDASPVVFMLWGAYAQRQLEALLFEMNHEEEFCPVKNINNMLVLKSNHPSPLSARRPPVPFLGNNHFSEANTFFQKQGLNPIKWV